MDIKSGLFYLFSALLLFGAFRVITARNPVHAVLFLVFTFFQASCLWMMLKAEFLAVTLVLVYVGAVMVLFLFVVMMLDINIDTVRKGFWAHFPLAAALGAVFALEMATVLMAGFRLTDEPKVATAVAAAAANVNNTKELGKLLYTGYLLPMQVAAVILLVAMIVAIGLTLRERKDSKHVPVFDQVRVKSKDRMLVMKVDAVVSVPPAPAVEVPAEEKKA